MTDPFSVAAGVAGIIALSGTIAKSLYHSYLSIHEAPSIARDLTAALYTLNIALSQIQANLLSPSFVSVADDEQLNSIEACLQGCTVTFDAVNARLEASGLAASGQRAHKQSWASVKALFNEKQMQNCPDKIEREKTTLLMVVSKFSA